MSSSIQFTPAISSPIPPAGAGSAAHRVSPASSHERSWFDRWLLFSPLFGVTLFGKAAIPPFGAKGLALAMPLAFIVIFVQALRGTLVFDPIRLACFLLILVITLGLPVLHGEHFSLPSVALLIVLFLPFACRFPNTSVTFDDALGVLLGLCKLIAILGLGQYLLQFFLPHEMLFPVEYYVPEFMRVSLFANEGPLAYGSALYRSNGVVMLEPSVYSQLMALGVIAELSTRNRILHALLYFAALVVSYSGTGIMALALAMPILIVSQRRWDLLIYILVVAAVISVFSPYLNLDIFINRSGELSSQSTGSSGYARFLGGFFTFNHFSQDSLYYTLFGHGPGSARALIDRSPFPTAEMTLFKSILELGIVGSFLFLGYVLWAVFDNAAPLAVKFILAVIFFLGGTFTLLFPGIALSLLIWPRPDTSSWARAARGAADRRSTPTQSRPGSNESALIEGT
ncbi:hypothetical protein VVD49_19065 [Uliginosibacterium sp. H3]|uniref:O-antigen ligase like membrane protein n=1 Tax=Uliginosibacterium silvisoli TaxID=3114758 RepID=A0ABU6K806_9RHOO|nr:hypothetical protein [Uliginosibacterium sp. H3]